MNEKNENENKPCQREVPLTNVERAIQQSKELKEAKQREAEKSKNPYPHTLRD